MRFPFATLAVSALCAAGAVTLSCVVSCATTPTPAATPQLTSRAYVPLAVGNRWVYAVTPSPADKPTEEVRILDRNQQGFFVDNRGGALAPRTDGIFDGKRFLLQDPIEEGREWMAAPEPSVVERYRIKATDVSLQVQAGSFTGCVEVEGTLDIKNPQTGELGVLTMSWIYAPQVGLVRLVQTFRSGEQPAQVVARMELVSFDVTQTQ